MKRTTSLMLWAAPALLTFAWGCGDAAPPVSSSSEEVQVKGTVTHDGKPVAKGTIQFETANTSRRDGPNFNYELGADGTYSGKTLIGQNLITIIPPANYKGQFPLNHEEVTLKAGENTVDVDVSGPIVPSSPAK